MAGAQSSGVANFLGVHAQSHGGDTLDNLKGADEGDADEPRGEEEV